MNVKGIAELLKDIELLKVKAKVVKANAKKKLDEVESSTKMKEDRKDKWDEYIESVLDIVEDVDGIDTEIVK